MVEIFTTPIETESVICHLAAKDIFYARYKPDSLIGTKEIEIVFNEYKKQISNGPLKVIVEFGRAANITQEAREYLEKHKEMAICEAVIIDGLAQRLVISFYFKFKSHNHPSKVFRNVKNAIKWVNSF